MRIIGFTGCDSNGKVFYGIPDSMEPVFTEFSVIKSKRHYVCLPVAKKNKTAVRFMYNILYIIFDIVVPSYDISRIDLKNSQLLLF
jgi:hypothetical protein